jgi:hypothetical protein
MENFFNYITKPLSPEDVDIWFRANNIILEKLELFSDFSHSLNYLIVDTYLGESSVPNETKITLSTEDKIKHFTWCWNKVISNFEKEGIHFENEGEHYEYFKTFFEDIFYNQPEDKIRNSIGNFFNDLFDREKPFTKSDLDMIATIYKILDRSIKNPS